MYVLAEKCHHNVTMTSNIAVCAPVHVAQGFAALQHDPQASYREVKEHPHAGEQHSVAQQQAVVGVRHGSVLQRVGQLEEAVADEHVHCVQKSVSTGKCIQYDIGKTIREGIARHAKGAQCASILQCVG